uniref:cation diffusion facilitator family transporter n=1 Tax=Orrella sp. TaxID=1921583 RepID=UPI004048C440
MGSNHYHRKSDKDQDIAGAQSSYTAAQRGVVAKRTTLVSVVVNIVLSTLQIAVGFFARSQALIADGIHSLSDLLSDFVVLIANHHSQKDPDEDHPYGHQRFETAASLIIGLALISVGLGMVWFSVERIMNPDNIPDVAPIALAIAILTLFTKEGLFRYMLTAAKRVKSSMLVANAWHARSDAASSLVVAIGILGHLLGYKILDPIAALIVGLMIARMGWRFGSDSFNDLMDRGIDEKELQEITQTLNETPGVLGVHDIRTRKMGDMVLVDAHIEVDRTLTVEQGHDIVVAARDSVMRRHRVLDLMAHVDPVDAPKPGQP